ncbi:hypothetical protein GCM10023091_28030 [Ravibacter arvi]|uniref:GDP-mannose pyrophosphatase n=1 Tax=Ravibacter arvi TaxID=2051041 RepID=A0ABP8M2H0_9BACT
MGDRLLESHKIALWKSRLEKNGNHLLGIEPLYQKFRADGSLLFALVNTDAVTPEGEKLLPLCFIKGEVVSVLICLIDERTGEKFLMLVRQRRICDGSHTYEHPAGMLDDETDPYAVAIREVHEETGIAITRGELVHLHPDRVFFPSTATSDEAMHLLYAELILSSEAIWALHERHTGEASENESITTHVVSFEAGYRLITNTNALLHCFMYLSDVADWELLKRLKQ